MDRDEIRLREKSCLVHKCGLEFPLRVRGKPLCVGIDDSHAETQRPVRHGLPDPPHSKDPERHSVNVHAEQKLRPPRVPFPRPKISLAFADPACCGHQQRVHARSRWCLRQNTRRICHGDAALSRLDESTVGCCCSPRRSWRLSSTAVLPRHHLRVNRVLKIGSNPSMPHTPASNSARVSHSVIRRNDNVHPTKRIKEKCYPACRNGRVTNTFA